MATGATLLFPMSAPPTFPERPKLRASCRFILQEFRDGMSWVLEDAATGKFFRVGLREERLARRLTGEKTVPELLALSAEGGEEELGQQETFQILQALQGSGLLEDEKQGAPGPALRKAPFNPLYIRLPLGNPDRLLDGAVAIARRLPLRTFGVATLFLVAAALYALVVESERLAGSVSNVFSVHNAALFMACFVGLKVIHEAAHGVVCKYFGGRVPQAGLYFVFFAPLTYIDATDSWRFPSKWVRMLVTAAGMLAELFVASVATLVWANTAPGLLNTVAFNVLFTASVTTLLFNANPLMRFDGYFLLTDFLRYPNLYGAATKAAHGFYAWLFLGKPRTGAHPRWVTAYGVACGFWRLSLVSSICIGAIALLHGVGLALAGMTIVALLLPLGRLLLKIGAEFKAGALKFSPLRTALLLAALAVIIFVPLEPAPACPGVIEPVGATPIRIHCPGFVEEIAVEPGQLVEPGALLVKLANPQEHVRVATLELGSRRAEAVANTLRNAADPKQVSQHLEQAQGMKKRAREAAEYIATLALRAPMGGMIYGGRLDDLPGTFLRTGREVMTVGSATEREARIAISHELHQRIKPQLGQALRVLVPGRLSVFNATITAIESAATREIRFPALTALAGGPLATVSSSGRSARGGNEVLEPHFYITALMEPSDAVTALRQGEMCAARFPSAQQRTMLEVASARVQAFIRNAERRGEVAP